MPCLAVIFTNFGPYHIARLQAAHSLLKVHGWETLGIEIARNQVEYQWHHSIHNLSFQLITLFQEQAYEDIPLLPQIQKMLQVLSQLKPDVVAIAGYSEPSMLTALAWAKLNQKKTILLSASKVNDKPRRSWKELIKRYVVQSYNAALVGGQPQKRYLQHLGLSSSAISCGYNVVNNAIFSPQRIKSLQPPLNKKFFLSINRFVPKKNLIFLLHVYAEYRATIGLDAWDLVLCGDGTLRPQIERTIAQLAIAENVHLPGFLQQAELLPYFAHAGCFIHASIQEQWGLVVNEAMAAGLPVLVSENCGCYEDLIIEGVTGFGFNPKNHQQLRNLMIQISLNDRLDIIYQDSFRHIQTFSPSLFAEGLLTAVHYVVSH